MHPSPRERIQAISLMCIGIVWGALLWWKFPPPVAFLLTSMALGAVWYTRHVHHPRPSHRQRRLIASQPNATDRSYLIEQRLAQLTYHSTKPGAAPSYMLTNPVNHNRMLRLFHHRLSLDVRHEYQISFVDRELVRGLSVGNCYRETSDNYYVSSAQVDVIFVRAIETVDSVGTQLAPTAVLEQTITDTLPDDVIRRVEHALLNWQPALQGQ